MTGLFVIFNLHFSHSVSLRRRIYFTKLFKPVIKMWRSNGIPIAVFVDDRLGGGATELTAKIHSLMVHSDLIRFGFIVNLVKSQWDPFHVIVWLGGVIDTVRGTIAATDQRLRKFVNFIDFLSDCESRVVKARDLASLIDMIISFSPFVGNVTRIMTRSLYLTIILLNRAEYRLILSRLGLRPRRLKSDDIPRD